MSHQTRSNITFFVLLDVLTLAAVAGLFLPQGGALAGGPPASLPSWRQVIATAGLVLALYGLLGFLGLVLWRRLGFPEIWEPGVSARERFLLPGLAGAGLGFFLIGADLWFSRFNGIGRLPHPPFPASLVASLAAGIGEEMIFRLFFISFWTWLVGRVLLRDRGLPVVYWAVSCLAALAFSAAHLPAIIYLLQVGHPAALPPVLLLELILMNGTLGLAAAWFLRRWGFLPAVGVHFWADVAWHVLYGLVA